jgi:peptidoglycan/xylan/chitin deacetylase (PgdA/CDA1 family)
MNSIRLAGIKNIITLMSGLGKQKKLFVLIYHRVLDEPDFMRPGEVDKSIFSWHIALLAKYFNVLSVADAIEKLKTNTLPSRAVCITFDDGYADNLHNAIPILKKHNLTATFFIASGYLDGGRMWNDTIIEALRVMPKSELDLNAIGLGQHNIATPEKKQLAAIAIIKKLKYLEPSERLLKSEQIASYVDALPNNLMLTSAELKEMYQHGMDIGGHTVTHPIMARLDESCVLQEIIDNKNRLEQLLNTTIHYFAYPNGKLGEDYLLEHVKLMKNTGYLAAFSTHWGVANANSDLGQLPRFTPWDKTPLRFMLRIASMYRQIKVTCV